MAKRKGSSRAALRAIKKAAKDATRRDAWEVQNAQHLGKLPREVWRKVLGNLKSDDLFPLALSCRYFLQKIVARTLRREGHQSGRRECRLALRTNLRRMLAESKSVSAEYVNFAAKRNSWRTLMMRRTSFSGGSMRRRKRSSMSSVWRRFMVTCLCCRSS